MSHSFHGSGDQHGSTGLFPQHLSLKVLASYGLIFLWERLWFQAYSCYWQNSVPCKCKTEVPFPLLKPTWGQSQLLEVAASSFSMAFSLTRGLHNLAATECFKANSRISPCQIFMLWVSPSRKSPFHFSSHLIGSTPLKIISFLKASNHQSDIPSFSREGSYIRM